MFHRIKKVWQARRVKKLRGLLDRAEPRRLLLEPLEERRLLTAYHWTGADHASSTNWTDVNNWSVVAGSGTGTTYPKVAGDVALFTDNGPAGALSAANSTVTVNAANISVGQIDFGTAQNVTINGDGVDALTLDGTNLGSTSIINQGVVSSDAIYSYANSGIDQINAQVQTANTPLAATLNAGTLQLTNTATGTLANSFSATSTFTVNTGATLRESALGTGSQVTGNLVDTGASSNATLNLTGGQFTIDPTASTASNGLGTKFISGGSNPLATYDLANAAALAGSPKFVTSGFNTPTGQANTFSFGNEPGGPTTPFYPGSTGTAFNARFTGMINITQPGPVTFQTDSDDTSKLFVDGVEVVNNDGAGHATQFLTGTVTLTAGLHNIQVDYGNGSGGGQLGVSYAQDGGALQTIPFSALYTPDNLTLGNAVTVSGASTIQLNGSAFTTVGLGQLTFNNVSADALTVNALAGKKLTFLNTVNTGIAPVTLNDSANVALSTNAYVAGTVYGAPNNVLTATTVGTTATLTYTGAFNDSFNTWVGQSITVAGVSVGAYNGTFAVTGVGPGYVTYTVASGTGAGTGGVFNPPQGNVVLTGELIKQGTGKLFLDNNAATPANSFSAGVSNIDQQATGTGTTATLTYGGSSSTFIGGESITVSGVEVNNSTSNPFNGSYTVLTAGAGYVTYTASGSVAGLVGTGGSITGTANGNIVAGVSESGNTVTVAVANSLVVNQVVTISGVSVNGSTSNAYNGTFTVASASANSFTYTDAATGLNPGDSGTVTTSSYSIPNGISETGTLVTVYTGATPSASLVGNQQCVV